MNNVQQIGADQTFTYIVDPNPPDNETISPEDLLTYVSLTAYPKSRSIIADDNTFNNFTESEVVKFVTTTEQNGDNYVTTNYLNIGGLNKTDEAFGIKNIDIKYGASFVPEVNITFIDSRGAGVFNGYEFEDQDGVRFNSSTFSSFFRLPYPIYELTVKGFYGKAVTYCLHLKKFNSKFNADTGNFEITAEFIGYTFAFLADIMMNYVLAICDTDEGIAKLQEDNLISINTLLQGFGQITRLTESFKDTSEEYQQLKVYNTLLNRLQVIQNRIGFPLSEDSEEIFTANINVTNVDNRTDLTFIRDVGILNANKNSNHDVFFQEVNEFAGSYNEFIEDNLLTYPYINNFKLQSFFVSTPFYNYNLGDQFGLQVIKEEILKNEPNYDVDLLVTVDLIKDKLQITDETTFDFVPINYFSIRKSINDLIQSLRDEKRKQEEVANKRLNSLIENQLGFNPTIQEVFNVIIGNVDAFLGVIYDYAFKADTLGQQRIGNLSLANTDIPFSSNKIYPFPAVIDDNGENAWLGDIVGENNPNFPELQLVNKVIESLLYITNKNNKTKSTQSLLQRLKLQNDDWFPINAIDYTNNGYFNINNINFQGNVVPIELVEIILRRLLVSYNYSRYGYNTNAGTTDVNFLRLIAEMEAAYAEHKIVDEDVENIIATYNTPLFVDTIIQRGLGAGIISRDINGNIQLNNDTLNGYNFTNSLGIFISEDEQAIYTNITDNNIKQFAKNQQEIISNKRDNFENLIVRNKDFHSKLDLRNYFIQRDLTDRVWSEEVQTRLKQVYKQATGKTLINDKPTEDFVLSYAALMKIFDGFVIDNSAANGDEQVYLNNEHNNIGRNLTPLELSSFENIFDTPYYQSTNNLGKALLLLKTFNFQSPDLLFSAIEDVSCLTKVPKLYLLWVGANFYRHTNFINSNTDIIDVSNINFIQGTFLGGQGAPITFLQNPEDFSSYSDEVRLIFENYFINWVNNSFDEFEETVQTYRTIGLSNPTIQDADFQDYKNANNSLLIEIRQMLDVVVLSPQKIVDQNIRQTIYPNLGENFLRDQLSSWHITFKKFVNITNANPQPDSSFQTAPTFDNDFKIRVYNDFKEIYDKWLSYGAKDGKIYNNCGFNRTVNINGQTRDKKLIEHFHFIDRTWSYIGDQAVINPKSLLVLSDTPDINLYSYIGRVLRESKFNFHVLPSYVNYYSIQEVSEMFEPQVTIDNVNSGPTFVAMYVGGNSKVLDIGNEFYVNDGFDLRDIARQSIPNGFVNRRIPAHLENIVEEAGKYNMAAFRVSYADQNQSIFKDVAVTQEEHRNTGEFLQVLSDLFDNRGGTQRFYKGTDLYNLYSVRSYASTIKAMGNMQIQPLQYYQLDNIPLFHGAYMITSVNHSIQAHNVTTTFKGYRMPKVTYPVVDVVTSYIQLPLNEVVDSELIENNITFNEYGVASNGVDNTNQIAPSLTDDVANSTRILFDFGNTEFRLLPDLDEPTLNNNLARVLNNNPTNTYGLGKYRCYAWIKNVLADIGVVQTPAFGIDVWDFFANLGDSNMRYINTAKSNNFTNQDLINAGVPNGSFLFGFYRNSPYLEESFDTINNTASGIKKTNLTTNRRNILAQNFTFNPISHIGIFYNNQFYHLLGNITQTPTPSFYPIAYYEFLPSLRRLSRT